MHLCSECERECKIEIARYVTTTREDLYDTRANNAIYLCERHLRLKTDYQIRNATKTDKDAKDPKHLICANAYKSDKS